MTVSSTQKLHAYIGFDKRPVDIRKRMTGSKASLRRDTYPVNAGLTNTRMLIASAKSLSIVSEKATNAETVLLPAVRRRLYSHLEPHY